MAATVEVKCADKRCGKMFTARVADRDRGWGRFCSKSCKAIVQEKRTGQHAAFKARVAIRQEEDDDLVADDMLGHFSGEDNG